MSAKIIRIIDRGLTRLLTSQNRLFRAGDRLFEKLVGGKIQLMNLAPAMGPEMDYSFSVAGGGAPGRTKAIKGRKGLYRVIRPFAEGGMSKLFLVEDLDGDQHLMKTIDLSRLDPAVHSEIIRRFQSEIEIMARIESRNVVRLIDRDPNPLSAFFIMEYIQGTDLWSLIGAGKRTKPQIAVAVMTQVLQGLIDFSRAIGKENGSAAHRDIKPENILLEVEGKSVRRAVIADFGIAKLPESQLTGVMDFRGTPAWSPPETLPDGSKSADQRTDIYAVGAVLYWMLTGREPVNMEEDFYKFVGDPAAVLAKLRPNKPQDVGLHLWNTVLKAMAARPELRYRNYEEFQSALILSLREGRKIG